MKEIKKIKIISLANMAGLIYLVIGGAISMIIYFFSLAYTLVNGNFLSPLWKFILFNIGLGIWAGIYIGLVSGIIGWLLGLISGWMYNIFVKKIGGIKVDLEEEIEEKKEINEVLNL